MKTLIIALSSLFSVTAFARPVTVDFDFSFKNQIKSIQFKDKSTLDSSIQSWTAMGPSEHGVVLLGKISEPVTDRFLIDYMIVDSEKSPACVQEMAVESPAGIDAGIRMESEENVVSVTAQINPPPHIQCSSQTRVPASGCEINNDADMLPER